MKLLVSVINSLEARTVLDAGCDIIDIKNPLEGSLGANHPNIIREIVKLVNGSVEISATIGDLPNLPGTASLAALGAASLGVNYIKAGIYDVKRVDEAVKLSRWIVEAINSFSLPTKVIICGYGDAEYIGSIHPRQLPFIAYKSEASGILIDLKSKTSETIFDYLSHEEISSIVKKAHDFGLTVALAGGLGKEHINILRNLEIDIMGVRRNVCNNMRWTECRISYDKVKEMYNLVKG